MITHEQINIMIKEAYHEGFYNRAEGPELYWEDSIAYIAIENNHPDEYFKEREMCEEQIEQPITTIKDLKRYLEPLADDQKIDVYMTLISKTSSQTKEQ